MFTAGILGRIAFSAFGKRITFGLILKVILGVILTFLVWTAYDKVRDHFQHIADLESRVTTLTADNRKLETQKTELLELNRANAKTIKTMNEQRAAATVIADTEVKATTVRITKTKERADVIRNTPPTSTPVDPVIIDTLNSLWRQGSKNGQ